MQRNLIAESVLNEVRTVVYSVTSDPQEVGFYHSHGGFTVVTVVKGLITIESWDGTERYVLTPGESQKESITLHRVVDGSAFGSKMVVIIQHHIDFSPMRDIDGNPIYI